MRSMFVVDVRHRDRQDVAIELRAVSQCLERVEPPRQGANPIRRRRHERGDLRLELGQLGLERRRRDLAKRLICVRALMNR